MMKKIIVKQMKKNKKVAKGRKIREVIPNQINQIQGPGQGHIKVKKKKKKKRKKKIKNLRKNIRKRIKKTEKVMIGEKSLLENIINKIETIVIVKMILKKIIVIIIITILLLKGQQKLKIF